MARTRTEVINGHSFTIEENRVRVKHYGGRWIDSANDPRLVVIPTAKGRKKRKMHWLAAAALQKLIDAAALDGFDLRAADGWRPKRFATREIYEAWLVEPLLNKKTGKYHKRYPSVAVGKFKVGYVGAHHLGLAVDFGTEGLTPSFGKGHAKQKEMERSPMWKWLVVNAATFGFTPLLGPGARGARTDPYQYHEPWHWEFKLSKKQWESYPDGADTEAVSRAILFAGANRRSFQGAANTQTRVRNEIAAAQIPVISGEFVVDSGDLSGVLYDFQTGKWNDEA